MTLLGLLASLVIAPGARAETLLGGYRTPGCEHAPLWLIGYRLYWVDSQGRTASRAGFAALEDHARVFSEDVGVASHCGVRVQLDLYDEGDTPWPATSDWTGYPSDTAAFQARHGYDAVFARFPEIGDEGYSGVAQGGLPDFMRAKFPGSATPLTPWGVVEPMPDTLWHEWMHLVVAFYTPRLGWPAQDVHGACAHNYPNACTGGSAAPYFTDMMNGRVLENGRPKGILPSEWAYYGTPTHPHNQDPGLYVKVRSDGGNAGWKPLVSRVILTYTSVRTGRRTYRKDVTRGVRTLLPPMPPGTYKVCLTSTANDRFRAEHVCDTYRVLRR